MDQPRLSAGSKEEEVVPCPPSLTHPPPARTGWRRLSRRVFFGLGILTGSAALGLVVDGELGSFLEATWEVVLFAVLCVLASVGLEAKSARVLSWMLWAGLIVLGLGFNLLASYTALSPDFEASPPAGALSLLGFVACLSILAAGLGILPQLRGVRSQLQWLTPTRDWTSVQLLALGTVLSFTALCLVPLAVLGAPPLLMMLQAMPNPESFFDDGRGVSGLFRDQMYSLTWTLVAATLAVGYGVRRSWPETLERLGLRRLTVRQTILAVGLTALLLGLGYLTDAGITGVWKFFGWRPTDAAAVEMMFAPFISPLGAVVVAITAGLGEEVAVRGILQPRLGILLSNGFFTALHAYQYGWDALTSVFITGLLLGLIRKRTSTSVSALVHGGFDFVLVMLEVG